MVGSFGTRRGHDPAARWLMVVAIAMGSPVASNPAPLLAQTKSKVAAETIKGKIKEVEVKGKTATVMVSREDGDDLKVLVTAKLPFGVEGAGTKECIRQGVVIASKGVVSNNQYFCSEFTVYVGAQSPPLGAVQDPEQAGQWVLVGQVLGGDEMGLNCSFGAGGQRRVAYDTAATVTVKVVSGDLKFLAVDQECEVTGTFRGKNFVASALKVEHGKEFTPDDLFSTSKVTKTKTPKTTVKKGKTDEPEKDAAGGFDKSADPFGVLNKKDAKKPEAKKPAKSDTPKDAE